MTRLPMTRVTEARRSACRYLSHPAGTASPCLDILVNNAGIACAPLAASAVFGHILGVGPVPLRSPEYWRVRAEEARAIAEGMNSRDGMQEMLHIADLYDQLAARSEHFAGIYPDVKWMDDPP